MQCKISFNWWRQTEGGLISEFFHLSLSLPKKVPNHYPEHYPLAPFWGGDLSQNQKLSEIQPHLVKNW